MNRIAFIKELRATAKELLPLAQSVAPGALIWNGTKYANSDEPKFPNPYALSWQMMLEAIAELLEAQESPLSEKQTGYLEGLLFGGMGSLNDLAFDPRSDGDLATTVNDRLDKHRRALYVSFKKD